MRCTEQTNANDRADVLCVVLFLAAAIVFAVCIIYPLYWDSMHQLSVQRGNPYPVSHNGWWAFLTVFGMAVYLMPKGRDYVGEKK